MPVTAVITGGTGKTHGQGGHYTGTYTGGTPTQLFVNDVLKTNAVVAAGAFDWKIGADSSVAATYGTPGAAVVRLGADIIDTMTIRAAPISELILNFYKDAIATITEVDSEFSTPQKGNIPSNDKVIVSAGFERDAMDEEEVPLMHDGYLLPIHFTLFVTEPDTSATAIDQRIQHIKSLVMDEVNEDYTSGDYGQNIFWKPEKPAKVNDAYPGLILTVEVLYYTLLGDRYNQ